MEMETLGENGFRENLRILSSNQVVDTFRSAKVNSTHGRCQFSWYLAILSHLVGEDENLVLFYMSRSLNSADEKNILRQNWKRKPN